MSNGQLRSSAAETPDFIEILKLATELFVCSICSLFHRTSEGEEELSDADYDTHMADELPC